MPYRGAKVVGGHAVGNFNEKVENGKLKEGDDKHKIQALIQELENTILN